MDESFRKEFYRIAVELYPQGPAQSSIWKRSGGDLGCLFLTQSGRDSWYEALERLFNGGGGQITVARLLEEMRSEFLENSDLEELDKALQSFSRKDTVTLSLSVVEETSYNASEQSWFVKDFPDTKNIDSADLSLLAATTEIIIFTVTDVELLYALSYLNPLEARKKILKGMYNSETYYIGRFGAFNAVVTKCQMGISGVGAATLATEEGLRFWQPNAAFMVGIAFGKDPYKQHLGQVLVGSSVISYENQRVGKVVVSRGVPLPTDPALLNRFENSYDWKFSLPDGIECKKEIGPLLSGEKLVDNLEYKNELFTRHPTAIGGEMEGAGFYAASHRKRIPCIVLKSICDWGDGHKNKEHQPLAAASAVSLLFSVLKKKGCLIK